MKEWLKLNKEDQKVLLIIMVLYALLVAFMWINKEKTILRSSTAESSQASPIDYYVGEQQGAGAESSADAITLERDTLPIKTTRYPGPPTKMRDYTPKLAEGATLDLNNADTLLLQRVPSIGASFARRIVKYRDILGGYYCVEQLQEVYGMDRERYDKIAPYFVIRKRLRKLSLSADSIPKHPYISYKHRKALAQILVENPPLSWEKIMSVGQFSKDDSLRLAPYLELGGDR